MQEYKSFGQRLKAERLRLEMTQPEIADVGRVSKASQVLYESGQTAPDAGYLFRVQHAGVDVAYVLSGVPSRLSAVQNLDWELFEQLMETIKRFEQTRGAPLSASASTRLLRLLYAACAPLNKVDQALVDAALSDAA